MTGWPMVENKAWLTEFDLDGDTYAGPIVLADCLALAQVLCADCLRAPNGELLRVTGRLQAPVEDVPEPRTFLLHDRRAS